MQWYEPCLINVVGTMHMSASLVAVVQLLRGKELETVGLMIGVPVPVGGPTNKYTFKTTLVSWVVVHYDVGSKIYYIRWDYRSDELVSPSKWLYSLLNLSGFTAQRQDSSTKNHNQIIFFYCIKWPQLMEIRFNNSNGRMLSKLSIHRKYILQDKFVWLQHCKIFGLRITNGIRMFFLFASLIFLSLSDCRNYLAVELMIIFGNSAILFAYRCHFYFALCISQQIKTSKNLWPKMIMNFSEMWV